MAMQAQQISSNRQPIRKSLAWLHTWSGLIFGLGIVLLAVTGAGLILRPQLDSVVNAGLLTVPSCNSPMALDRLVRNAQTAYPDSKPYAIEVTKDPSASLAVRFADYNYVYLDPCLGTVLGSMNHYAGFFGVMDWLHRFRFFENGTGRPVGGWVNLIFLTFLIVGGIMLWWPKSRASLKSAVRLNRKLPGTARTLNLHKIVGLYAGLVLLLVSLTAVPFSFQVSRDVIAWATHSSVDTPAGPAKLLPHSKGAKRLSMQDLWMITQSRFPQVAWVSLYYPKKSGAIEAEMLESTAPHSEAKSYLYLDPYTGTPLKEYHYATNVPLGRKVYLWFLAFHSGLVGGLPYQLLLLVAILAIPVQAYTGASAYLRRKFRKPIATKLSLRLVRKVKEAEGIQSFEFADPTGRPLPPFSAGSHIDVTIAPGITRQYSLCNDPKETHRYLIAVLKHADSRGGSQAMHETLSEGDIVEASVPRNHFPLAHGASNSLLLAAGIGITPILCMAERLANSGSNFQLHYCVRSCKTAAFLKRINESAFADHVNLHVSSEGARLDVASLLASQSTDTHLYVCGPASFMRAVLRTAEDLGWPQSQLHTEYFAAEKIDTGRNTAFEVKIASSGKVVLVDPQESVVSALSRLGIEVPTSCSEGVCGTCLTRVVEGEVEHHDMILTAEQRAQNDQFTPCCSRARSPLLVLDL